MTLFSARTGPLFFFQSKPSLILATGATLSLGVSTAVASAWPINVSPGDIPVTGLARLNGGAMPVFVWIYCLIWWLIQDTIKVLAYKVIIYYDVFWYSTNASPPTYKDGQTMSIGAAPDVEMGAVGGHGSAGGAVGGHGAPGGHGPAASAHAPAAPAHAPAAPAPKAPAQIAAPPKPAAKDGSVAVQIGVPPAPTFTPIAPADGELQSPHPPGAHGHVAVGPVGNSRTPMYAGTGWVAAGDQSARPDRAEFTAPHCAPEGGGAGHS